MVQFRIFDGDFNTNRTNAADSMQGSSSTNLSFNSDTSISPISITQTFNNYFASNNVKIEASFTSSGKLELRSTETGEDAKKSQLQALTLTLQGQITKLGLINGQMIWVNPGEPAKYIGRTHESISTVGFELDGAVTFTVTDRYGSKAQQINVFGADGLELIITNLATDEKHTISKEMLASILDNGSHNQIQPMLLIDLMQVTDLNSTVEAPVIQLESYSTPGMMVIMQLEHFVLLEWILTILQPKAQVKQNSTCM